MAQTDSARTAGTSWLHGLGSFSSSGRKRLASSEQIWTVIRWVLWGWAAHYAWVQKNAPHVIGHRKTYPRRI